MGVKSWLRGVASYAQLNTTPPPPLALELYEDTAATLGQPAMSCGPVQAMLLQTIVAATHAKRVLEVGMYTGFSALMMAEALPDDGELITCEIDPELVAFARRYLERSPHARKIYIREGPAIDTLRTLNGPFDFVYLDADKQSSVAYYELALPMVKPGGLIAVDDVLLGALPEPRRSRGEGMATFNEHIRNDPRVTQVVLTIRNGLTLVRKL